MKLHTTKLFLVFFVSVMYISIGVFGLLQFAHFSKAPMPDCPYVENSFSICNNNFNHINNWRQFSNITLSPLFIFSFLIFGIILYFLNKQNFSNQKLYFYKWKYYLQDKKLFSRPNRIIKWLSLLENSPSFSIVGHS